MPKMWRGPSADLKAARADPFYAAINRRAGRQSIAFHDEDSEHGRTIMVRHIYQGGGRCGTWFYDELGRVTGPDPILVSLWASHAYTDRDAELFTLHLQYDVQLLGRVADDLVLLHDGLSKAVDEFLAIFE